MEIEHTHNDRGGRFYVDEPDGSTTELVYRLAGPHKMVIDHTEVGEKYEGQGVGKELLATAVEYARQHQMKVLPLCRFAKAIMERDPSYQDVLVENN